MAANLLILDSKTAFGSQANSAVSFGIIGTGGRGTLVGTLMVKNPGTRLAAICDIYPDKIDLAKTNIPAADAARTFRDYKQMLAADDIDAVLISTPVFLHPEHFEAAVQADKHIYCEKPAGADVAGVKRLMRAAEKDQKDRVVQFGFQQRFAPQYLKAMDALRRGKIGDMKLMISYWEIGGVPSARADRQAAIHRRGREDPALGLVHGDLGRADRRAGLPRRGHAQLVRPGAASDARGRDGRAALSGVVRRLEDGPPQHHLLSIPAASKDT